MFYILYHLTGKKENVVRQIYKNLKLHIDISILQSVSSKTIGGYNTNTMKKTFILHFATSNTMCMSQPATNNCDIYNTLCYY